MLRRRSVRGAEPNSLKENLLESDRSTPRDDRPTSSEGAAFLKLAAATLLLVLLGFSAAAGIDAFFSYAGASRRQPFLRRLPGPRVAALPQFVGGGGDGNDNTTSTSWASRMLWGTYRSGSYLGLRTRSPRSLAAGLMWFDPDCGPSSAVGQHSFAETAPTVPPLRHEAQERDRGGGGDQSDADVGLRTFGWVRHDGEGYGEQRVVDFGGRLDLSTTFLKREVRGSVGGDWVVRVSAREGTTTKKNAANQQQQQQRRQQQQQQQRVSLLFYVADEGVVRDSDEANGPLELSGESFGIEVLPKGGGKGGDDVEGEEELEEEQERGRRQRAAAAAEALSESSSGFSSPVVLASGENSHPVGPWKLSLLFSSSSPSSSSKGNGGENENKNNNKNAVDLRYLGRRRAEPGALLRGLTEYVAAELERGGDVAASEASIDRAFSSSGVGSSTGLRRRRKEGSVGVVGVGGGGSGGGGGGGLRERLALTKHALPNEVDASSPSALSVVLDREEPGAGGDSSSKINLAVFQLTAELPFEADFVFVGGGSGGGGKTTTTPSPSSSSSSSVSSSLLGRLLLLRRRLRRPLLEEPLPPIPASTGGASPSSTLEERVAALSGENLTRAAAAAAVAFDARFDRVFGRGLKKKGSKGDAAADDELFGLFPEGTVESVSKAAISNLLGGMAYFYGSPEVKVGAEKKKKNKSKNGDDGETATTTTITTTTKRGAPGPLFTATPSRAFFPRGFLWDEGFHQLALMRWSRPLARDALAHWCDAVAASGWIPREQVLGQEAEARVPREFVAQDPSVANPPTLLLPLSAMAKGVAEAERKLSSRDDSIGDSGDGSNRRRRQRERLAALDPEAAADAELLEAAYPRVKAWVEWLLETQAGGGTGGGGGGGGKAPSTTTTTFRWRGRERAPDADAAANNANNNNKRQELNPKTLASGLDDYPRPSHPDDAEERHVDLLCWAALATRLLATVAEARGGGGEGSGSGGASAPADADAARFARLASSLGSVSNLVRNHWDAQNRGFFDWGIHTDDLALEWRYVLDDETGYPVDVVLARVPKRTRLDDDGEGLEGETAAEEREQRAYALAEGPRPRFVAHVGYVSLFPFLLRLIPRDGETGGGIVGGDDSIETSNHHRHHRHPSPGELLSASLDHVEHLLDPRSGLASLSRDSTFHAARNTEHDAPYWRGAVWPPVNYLALAALDYYAQGSGESDSGSVDGSVNSVNSNSNALRAAELRDRLRAAFVGNVVARATDEARGGGGVCDIWERYDDDGTQEAGRGGGRAEEGKGAAANGGRKSYPGAGLGPRPFTGWGSTVALAAAGIYFDL